MEKWKITYSQIIWSILLARIKAFNIRLDMCKSSHATMDKHWLEKSTCVLGGCENQSFKPRFMLLWEFGIWCIYKREKFSFFDFGAVLTPHKFGQFFFEPPYKIKNSSFSKVYNVGNQNKRIWTTIVTQQPD